MHTIILNDAQYRLMVAMLLGSDRSSLTREQGVDLDQLIEAVQTEPEMSALMASAGKRGARLADLAQVVGEEFEKSAFALAAESIGSKIGFSSEDVSFDTHVDISRSLDGAMVSAWVWVPNSAAGIPDVVEELVFQVVEHLEECDLDLDSLGHSISDDQIEFVSELFDQNQKALDRLGSTSAEKVMSRFVFNGVRVEKTISEVIKEVAAAAGATGFSALWLETLDLWLEEYGAELDKELAVFQY